MKAADIKASEHKLDHWQPCLPLGEASLNGNYAVLEPYDQETHAAALFSAVAGPINTDIWTYMPLGPFDAQSEFEQALAYTNANLGWKTMVIRCRESGDVRGMASYMRLRPEHGSAEVGCIAFGPQLKRTRIATEALYLMIDHALRGLGYRRFEWKCDNSNTASKNAAIRFGFVFEGVFRNDMVVKGRSRDTAWYSITDTEWPALEQMYSAWLQAENFDKGGCQRRTLNDFRV